MDKKFFLIIISLAFFVNLNSQNKEYARSILDTLCAPYFDGRGYYNKGEKRAAEFIASEFKKFGLRSVNDSYFQYFNLSVNSIVGSTKLVIDKQKLKAGKDFLINPTSPSFKGKSKLFYLSKEQLVDIEEFKNIVPLLRNNFVVLDKSLIKEESRETKGLVYELVQFLKFSEDVELNGVIELEEKLTYTASQQKALRPHLVVLKEKFCSPNKISLEIESEFNPNYQSQNVIGYIEGEEKDKFIYVVGHYDHLGRMGKDVYFPGANDNASGIAMLMSLAKEFAAGEKPKKSIVFICFGSEEIGLVGSKFYTENPLLPIESIDFLINLDILGTGDDGIQVVNGSVFKEEFEELVGLNESKSLLKQVKIRGAACNSDHCFFAEKGVPSFFIYTLGGIAHYHNIYDKSETLPLTEYEDLFVLLKEFIEKQ